MTNRGDVNPIPLLIIVVASRGFLSLVFLSVNAITEGSSTDLVDWVFIAIGTIPNLPGTFGLIVNVILFLALTLTPAAYGALLIKRLLNPVAN